MKSVLISIQPQWCELIASGKKKLEVRKTRPKLETPFKCYIYQTKHKWLYRLLEKLSSFKWARTVMEGQGKVIGEFVCDFIFPITVEINVHDELPGNPVESWLTWEEAPDGYETVQALEDATCLSYKDIDRYIGVGDGCYCWHISDLEIYDKPKELPEFTGLRKTKFGYEPVQMKRPPQSWCYVEEVPDNG